MVLIHSPRSLWVACLFLVVAPAFAQDPPATTFRQAKKWNTLPAATQPLNTDAFRKVQTESSLEKTRAMQAKDSIYKHSIQQANIDSRVANTHLAKEYHQVQNEAGAAEVAELNRKWQVISTQIAQLPPDVRAAINSDLINNHTEIVAVDKNELPTIQARFDALSHIMMNTDMDLVALKNSVTPLDSIFKQPQTVYSLTYRYLAVSAIDLVGNKVHNVQFYWLDERTFNQVATFDCNYPTCDTRAIMQLGNLFSGMVVPGKNYHFFAIQSINSRNEIIGYAPLYPKETELSVLVDVY